MICGTSTCHMAVSQNPLFVPGVWGPYYSAMVPGLWLSEGGQSATGRLLDHVIQSHPATPSITANTSAYVFKHSNYSVWTNSICILNHFFFFNLPGSACRVFLRIQHYLWIRITFVVLAVTAGSLPPSPLSGNPSSLFLTQFSAKL